MFGSGLGRIGGANLGCWAAALALIWAAPAAAERDYRIPSDQRQSLRSAKEAATGFGDWETRYDRFVQAFEAAKEVESASEHPVDREYARLEGLQRKAVGLKALSTDYKTLRRRVNRALRNARAVQDRATTSGHFERTVQGLRKLIRSTYQEEGPEPQKALLLATLSQLSATRTDGRLQRYARTLERQLAKRKIGLAHYRRSLQEWVEQIRVQARKRKFLEEGD